MSVNRLFKDGGVVLLEHNEVLDPDRSYYLLVEARDERLVVVKVSSGSKEVLVECLDDESLEGIRRDHLRHQDTDFPRSGEILFYHTVEEIKAGLGGEIWAMDRVVTRVYKADESFRRAHAEFCSQRSKEGR